MSDGRDFPIRVSRSSLQFLLLPMRKVSVSRSNTYAIKLPFKDFYMYFSRMYNQAIVSSYYPITAIMRVKMDKWIGYLRMSCHRLQLSTLPADTSRGLQAS